MKRARIVTVLALINHPGERCYTRVTQILAGSRPR